MIYQWSQRDSEKFRWLGNFIKQIICLLEFDKAWDFDKVCWKLILSIFVLMWVSACADGVCPRIVRIGTNCTNRHECFSLRWWGLPTNYANWHECFSLRWWGFAHEFHKFSRMFQLALIGGCLRIARIGTNFSLCWWGLPTNFTNVSAFIYWTNLKLYSYLVVLPAFLG